MSKEELEIQRKQLVEVLGIYFERERQIAPLAARILASLVINGTCGTTFDQLVTDLEASKSTISTHLTALEGQQWISYFTKTGDRKRYYTMLPGYINRKISALTSQWNKEIDLQKQIIDYKTEFNNLYPEQHYPLQAHFQSLKFLEEAVTYFDAQGKKYISIEQKE